MLVKSVKSYKGFAFHVGVEEYKEFEKACKRELKKQCVKYGINIHKFLSNHFEWSAVLERAGKFVYVHISDVRFWGDWYDDVLIRTMDHPNDWRGGNNNKTSFDKIGEFADRLLNN